MDINALLKTFALSVFLWVIPCIQHVFGRTVVEGFVGGSVIIPCNLLTTYGDLRWVQGIHVILIKTARGQVFISDTSGYKGDVSLVNMDDLRISPLKRPRDDNRTFVCDYKKGGIQPTRLQLLDPVNITGVSILEALKGRVAVTVGTPKTLTCSVTGDPNPPPSYSWSVDDDPVSIHPINQYTIKPKKSKTTIKCTASNTITDDESVFSQKEATVILHDVQFADEPSQERHGQTSETDQTVSNVNIGAAVGGGITAFAVIIIVIISVLLIRSKRMNSEEAIRPPEEQTVTRFHNGPLEGEDYQDLTTNPDNVNTTDNQPYATLGGNTCKEADNGQCDVPVNETKHVVRGSATSAHQYEDISFSEQGAKPEYISVYAENSENTDYENNTLTNYYNL